jgi:hypothetical protein
MKRKDKFLKIGEYEYTENELYENEDMVEIEFQP